MTKDKSKIHAAQKRWREKNKAKRAEYMREYAQHNRETINQNRRENLASKPEAHAADVKRSKKYWETHRAEHKQRMKLAYDARMQDPNAAAAEKQRLAIFRKEHRDEINARHRKWSESHREQHNQRTREYAKAHPEARATSQQRRRANKEQTVVSLTTVQVRTLFAAGCFFCGTHEKLTIAHDTPVSKKGNTTRGNVFCACAPCNSKMHTKALRDVLVQKSLSI